MAYDVVVVRCHAHQSMMLLRKEKPIINNN
jgi:hypothetical protein